MMIKNKKNNLKITPFRILWIITGSLLATANTCIKAILKGYTGTIERTWVNEELQRWVKRILRLVRVECRVVNPHNVQPQAGQPTIIMCNHSSLYDIPLSLFAFPQANLRMLAKIELFKIPLMGGAMRASEFPGIDRKNRHQAIQNLKTLHHMLESGIVIWIAPEGTRSTTGKLAAFKKGGFITAIQTKAMIIPVGIRRAHQILPAHSYQFSLHQTPEVHIGKPIDASQFTLENKETLIQQVHQSIQALIEAP